MPLSLSLIHQLLLALACMFSVVMILVGALHETLVIQQAWILEELACTQPDDVCLVRTPYICLDDHARPSQCILLKHWRIFRHRVHCMRCSRHRMHDSPSVLVCFARSSADICRFTPCAVAGNMKTVGAELRLPGVSSGEARQSREREEALPRHPDKATTLTTTPKINRDSFNRSFCCKNATVYGKGCILLWMPAIP
jgi:hypothetical protein